MNMPKLSKKQWGALVAAVAAIGWLIYGQVSKPEEPVEVSMPVEEVSEPAAQSPVEEVSTGQEAAEVLPQTPRDLQNGKPFRLVVPNNQHPIVRIMMLGFFEACDDYGVKCVMAGIDFTDTAQLLARGEEAISLGSSGVVYYPNEAYFENMRDIMGAGIPVVGFHVILPDELAGDVALAWVAADSIDYSKRAADLMAEKVECQGPIAVTLGGHNEVETPAAEAFTARMQELCDGIEVLAPEEEGFEPAAAIAKAAAILTAHPDVKGAYSTTGAGSTTWATALRDADYEPGQVTVISMDYSQQNLDWVAAGWVEALVGQPLYEETYKAVALLVQHLEGQDIEFANIYPAPLIQKDTIHKYYDYAARSAVRRWD